MGLEPVPVAEEVRVESVECSESPLVNLALVGLQLGALERQFAVAREVEVHGPPAALQGHDRRLPGQQGTATPKPSPAFEVAGAPVKLDAKSTGPRRSHRMNRLGRVAQVEPEVPPVVDPLEAREDCVAPSELPEIVRA